METRLSPGEKLGTKRMATVAAVYGVDRFIREPEDFVKELTRDPEIVTETSSRPRPVDKRVWASIQRDSKEVTREIVAEAMSRSNSKRKEWVVLVDGCPNQLRRISKELKRVGQKATIIVDIIHVIEYLWKASRALYGTDGEKCEEWVQERMIQILAGKSGYVAGGISRSATLQKLKPKDRAPLDTAAGYILKRTQYLDYKAYLTKGYPIATGVIEGACRHLLNDRLDITGARWSLTGAEAVVRLRSLKSSGDLDDYWLFYEKKGYEENYAENGCFLEKFGENSV
jgi:hypothetical protein